MNHNLKFFFLVAGDLFFKALEQMNLIVNTEHFKEYKHPSRDLFVRVSNKIQRGETISVWVEPQTNMTQSSKQNYPFFKIQLSCTQFIHNGTTNSASLQGLTIGGIGQEMTVADFIEGIKPCAEWKEIIEQLAPPEKQPENNWFKGDGWYMGINRATGIIEIFWFDDGEFFRCGFKGIFTMSWITEHFYDLAKVDPKPTQ